MVPDSYVGCSTESEMTAELHTSYSRLCRKLEYLLERIDDHVHSLWL